jgi:hypothetical protein
LSLPESLPSLSLPVFPELDPADLDLPVELALELDLPAETLEDLLVELGCCLDLVLVLDLLAEAAAEEVDLPVEPDFPVDLPVELAGLPPDLPVLACCPPSERARKSY